jgi:hypothetical protein
MNILGIKYYGREDRSSAFLQGDKICNIAKSFVTWRRGVSLKELGFVAEIGALPACFDEHCSIEHY